MENIEKALIASLTIMLGLSILDLFLYLFIKTAFLTVISNAISFFLLIRFRLKFDLVKLIETIALFTDIYIFSLYGFAIASPIACLLTVIIISFKKDKHMNKLSIDLEKIISSKKNLEKD